MCGDIFGCHNLLGKVLTLGRVILCGSHHGHCGVLSSIHDNIHLKPGVPPVMTTIDVLRHRPIFLVSSHPWMGTPTVAEGYSSIEKPFHSFPKCLMEACVCLTGGKNQLMTNINYTQRDKHGLEKTRQTHKSHSLWHD